MKTKEIALISILSVILVVQEQLLNILPNIQLTVLFIMVFSRYLGFKKTVLVILLYVLLDNVLYSGLPIVYIPFMVLGWCFIPYVLNYLYKGVDRLRLALFSVLFSFVYCWMFIIPSCLIMNISILDYLLADVIFELLMAGSSFISVLLLFNPCMSAMKRIGG